MQSFSKTHSWAAPQPRLVPSSPNPPNVKLCGQWAKGSVPIPGSEVWATHPLTPQDVEFSLVRAVHTFVNSQQ